MTELSFIILLGILLANLFLSVSSRMLHCIKMVALQGALLAVLPLLLDNGHIGVEAVALFVVNLTVKACLLPYLLGRTMRRIQIERELRPIVGYALSVTIVFLLTVLAFWLGHRLIFPLRPVSPLAVPVAIATMLTGLFIIVARRKALVQAMGFLVFENGIALFALGLSLGHGMIVELGILLDVLVLVSVMSIAVFHINLESSHTDTDRLNLLDEEGEGSF